MRHKIIGLLFTGAWAICAIVCAWRDDYHGAGIALILSYLTEARTER